MLLKRFNAILELRIHVFIFEYLLTNITYSSNILLNFSATGITLKFLKANSLAFVPIIFALSSSPKISGSRLNIFYNDISIIFD